VIKTLLLLLFVWPVLSHAADQFSLVKVKPETVGMTSKRLAEIPRRMNEFVASGKAAGIVTAVMRHGKLVNLDSVGYQELESKTPMHPDTIFRIMSLTKPMTSAAIMLLVDEGRLSLIDPVEKYLPEFKGQKLNPCGSRVGYHCKPVTPVRPIDIEDMMTHTSGLPASSGANGGAPPKTLAELVAAGAKTELMFEPGTEWSYSNIGYSALGRIIEMVSKQPYDEFMMQRLFTPLGMADTFFYVPNEKKGRVAAVHTPAEDKLRREPMAFPGPTSNIAMPAGGLFSTAADLLRFEQMLLNKGTLDGKRMLSAPAVELLTTSQTGEIEAGWAPGMGHGLGFEIVRKPAGMFRYNSVGTFAKGGAYHTYEWVDPAKDLAGVLMMQRTHGEDDAFDEINRFMALAAAAIEQ
jgi:CubicO group peptidase (beta-lactamase class C family)